MSTFRHLQTLSDQVEYALCGFDNQSNGELTDKDLLQLLELVFDKYYFMVSEPDNLDPAAKQRLDKIASLFAKELSNTADDVFIKVLGAIYRSIQRRTFGERQYLEFIHEWVGGEPY